MGGHASASQGGIHIKSPKRTSYGAFFDRAEDPVLANIDKRIAYVTRYPEGADFQSRNTVHRPTRIMV
jgi:hypothetical protein